MKQIAIIPARGGSKRIPRKNIRLFMGKPVLTYPIEAALSCGLFDEVMVSTDDKEIADIAASAGAMIPFLRSKMTSDDFATTADVVREVLTEYQKLGEAYDTICVIYPTAVLTSKQDLQSAFQKMIDEKADAILPVVRFSYPPQRGLTIQNNKVSFLHQNHSGSRSQDMEPVYHDAGQYYFVRMDAFRREGNLLPANTFPLIISEIIAQDIDDNGDWIMAEMKYKLRFG